MVTRDEEHFIMIKRSICQQDETIIHACKIHEPKPDRIETRNGECHSTSGDFNAHSKR